MSRSLNKVMLIGNVGAEPEVRTTSGGVKVANVSLATNREWSDRSGQKQEKTEWHRLTFWDKTAEIVERYVHKGDRLYVEGRVEYSQTQDDQGNVKHWTTVVVRELVMLGSAEGRPQGSTPGSSGRQQAPAPARGGSAPEYDDDLPF